MRLKNAPDNHAVTNVLQHSLSQACWLRVGENVVYRPRRDSVKYRHGTMTAPGGAAFEMNREASWLAVAVEAPKGLCGASSVQLIGTWDLLGRDEAFGGDNIKLVVRLMDWLSRRGG